MSIIFHFIDILCGYVDAVNMPALTCRFWGYSKPIVQNRPPLGVRIGSEPEPLVCRTLKPALANARKADVDIRQMALGYPYSPVLSTEH